MTHRISVVPVESKLNNQWYTVGLCFLNDLRCLLKLPDFARYFDWPILRFIKEMNYYDQDEFDADNLYGQGQNDNELIMEDFEGNELANQDHKEML